MGRCTVPEFSNDRHRGRAEQNCEQTLPLPAGAITQQLSHSSFVGQHLACPVPPCVDLSLGLPQGYKNPNRTATRFWGNRLPALPRTLQRLAEGSTLSSDRAYPLLAADDDPLYIAYHDEEWGRPVRDERGLYERLCLEGFQSGLAWITILRKREAFRRAFAGFDPEQVARFGERDVERLLGDAGIVRHRGKIEAAIANAQATLALRETATPLEQLMWQYRD